MKTPFDLAREAFNTYAAANSPGEALTKLQPMHLAALQVLLYQWTVEKVPKHTLPSSVENVLGATEEMGEMFAILASERIARLAHLELNISQGRRYAQLTEEQRRAKKADAAADAIIFLMNYLTAERLDFGTLVSQTIMEVTRRDWKLNPETAHLQGGTSHCMPDAVARAAAGVENPIKPASMEGHARVVLGERTVFEGPVKVTNVRFQGLDQKAAELEEARRTPAVAIPYPPPFQCHCGKYHLKGGLTSWYDDSKNILHERDKCDPPIEKCKTCRGYGYTKGGPQGPWEQVTCETCNGTGKETL